MSFIRMRKRRALVQRITASQTRGGLFLPETATNLSQLARVIAIGPDNPDNIQINDRVMIPKYGGYHYEHGGEEFLLIDIPDFLAVITL